MLCNSTAQVYYQSTKRFNEEIEQSVSESKVEPNYYSKYRHPLY